jgi:hypothetical protein
MKNRKVRILIPFVLTSIALIYCWVTLLVNSYIPDWKHYSALFLFAILTIFLVRDFYKMLVPLGIYLLLASVHIISLSYNKATFFFGPDNPYNPHFQLMSVGIFIVYLVLNLDGLIDMQLDREERKSTRR